MAQQKKTATKPKSSSQEKPHSPYILLVEDEPTHVAIIRHTIQSINPNAVVKVAGSLKEYRSVIEKSLPEIALIDMHLPDGKALEVLTSPLEDGLFPIVVMTSSGDEKIAVKAMKAGALDYVVKSTETFKTMPHTMERALREWKLIQGRKKAEEDLRESEQRFRSLYENVAIGLYRTTPAGKILLANQALVKMLGYASFEQLAERNLAKAGFAQSSLRRVFLRKIEMEGEVNDFESTWIRQDGSLVVVQESARAIRDSQGKTLYYDGVVEDVTERRLAEAASRYAEDALRESNEKYHDLFANTALGIFHSTFDGRFIDMNIALARLLGYDSPEEAANSITNIAEQVYTEPSRRDSVSTEVLKNGGMISVENHYRRKDGTTWDGMLHLRIVCDRQGKPSHYEGFIEDITDRKQAEKALRESEEKYRGIVEKSIMGIGISKGNQVIFANKALLRIFNYDDLEEFKKIPLIDHVAPYSRKMITDRMKMITEGNIPPEEFEYDIINKGGQIRTLNACSTYFSIEGEKYFQTTFQDITERKRAEVLLKVSEARYRLLADHMKDTIWLMDMDLKTTYISPSVEKLRGYTLKEIQQLPLDQQLAPASFQLAMDAFSEEMQKVTADPTYFISRTLELEFYRKDGTTYWSENRFSLIRDENGNPESIMGEGRDITDRKRAEEALKESNARLHLALESANSGAWEWDLLTNENIWSDELWKLYDLEPHSCVPSYDAWRQIIHPDDRENIERKVQEAARNGSELNAEWRVIDRGGTVRWLMSRGRPLRDANGKVIRFNGIVVDITERKRVEEALRVSESQFRELWGATVEGIVILDQGIIIEVNDALCKMFGYTREQVLGKSMLEFAPPEMYDRIRERIASGIEGRYETSAIRKDGTRIILEVFAKRFMYQGKPMRMVTANDITERNRSEEALRESEERYNALFERSLDLVYVCDFDGNFIDANDATLNLLGYKKEEIGSLNFPSLLSDDQLPLAFKVTQEIRETGIHKDLVEFRLRCKNGKEVYVELKGSAIMSNGKTVAIQSIARDITERKQAEENLIYLSSRQEAILSAVPNIIMEVNNDKVYTWANQSGIDFFGDDVIGKEASFYFEGEQEIYKIVEPLFKGDENVFYVESWQRRKDGEKRLLTWWCRVLKDKSGNVTGALSSARDITDQKRSEEAVRQMQKMEGLGTLAGGIAHDFNNILGIILAYNSSIKKFKDDTKKLDLATETITKTVQRGKTLVQQILTFARKTETEFGAVNVNDVVMEIVNMIFETFPKVLTYAQNIDKEIPFISADRSQLHQAVLNLCVNARDAMPSGGILTINTRMVSVESLRHQHPEAAASSYVCIEVSDTGEGMTEEIRKRIFEPFFTTKEIGKGTGLGLAVVFGIVQTHKGFIDVESDVGKGTTFCLYLPVSEVTEPISEKDEDTLEEIPGGTETLLVVEDEEMLMMSLQMVLVEKGYNVLSAGDGLAALKIYQENKNDIALVLTDLGLPTMTGLEVCQRIRQIKPNEHMILATGFLDPEMKSEFLKAGIRHFLYKPYDLKKVLKVVREVLDGK